MKLFRTGFLLLEILLVLPSLQAGQDLVYVFSFLENDYTSNFQGGNLYIVSTSASRVTSGTVVIPSIDRNIPFTVEAEGSTILALPYEAEPKGSGLRTSTLYIKSDQHIYVYGLNAKATRGDSFYPLPLQSLGQEYVIVTSGSESSYGYPTFSVTSVYDDTHVSIFFNKQNGAYNSTVPQEVTLQSLSTYVWRLSNFDFSGTKIEADKPISVSTGHEESNYGGNPNHLIEIIPPVSSWGQTFVLTAFKGRNYGYLLRVVAAYPDTAINLSPSGVTYEVPLWDAVSIQIPFSSPVLIESNKPVMVTSLFSKGPSMTVIPAVEQAIEGPITFHTLPTFPSYVTLWTSHNDCQQVLLDDKIVSWELVLSDTTSGCLLQTEVPNGRHTISHQWSKEAKFVGIVYGIDDGGYSSYAHPLPYKILKGEELEDNTAPTITFCHNVPVEVTGNPTGNTTSVTWLEPRASDEEGMALAVVSDWAPGDLFPFGSTTVTYNFTDVSGNQAVCSFDVIVHDVSTPVPSCPGSVKVESCGNMAQVSWTEPTVWDNSDGFVDINITSGEGPGNMFDSGTSNVLYLFTDESGNSETCQITVIVEQKKSLCREESRPYIIAVTMLGASLIPLIFTTGLLVQHSRSLKPPKERRQRSTRTPKNTESLQNIPPSQEPDEDNIYEFADVKDYGGDYAQAYEHHGVVQHSYHDENPEQ